MMPRIPSLIGAILVGVAAFAAPAAAGPSILFDLATGHVIESDRPYQRWYPASLTKLMTTYVAFRAVQSGEVTLLSPVRISRKAANEPPSRMGYKPGSMLTLDNALKIIMVKSANDIATAIGESLGGSQEAFAARMNAEARRLGMTGSHWVNAHGLHDDDQYTTARDLAILASALRREFPQYAGYFSIEGLDTGEQVIPSHNNIIGRFEGADGMKTGYTCPSGFNLVASATRQGRTVMAVIVGATSPDTRAEEAAALLTKGFGASASGSPTLATLPRLGSGHDQAVNMREELCTKKGREAAAKARKAEQARSGDKAGEHSPYLAKKIGRPRHLVSVSLGGWTGPMTKAVSDAIAADEPKVPLPTWRPDMPPPPGAEPLMQSETAAAANGQS
jgi:D-alanyl-D-alanine carboxypeptidase